MTGTLIDRLVLTRNDDVPRDPFRFSVADNEIVLANIGDYGGGGDAESAVADMVLEWTPDAVLTNGNNDYNEAAWGDSITTYYGAFVDRTALIPTPGPEDWEANYLDDYLDFFEDTIEGRKYYYKKTIGPVSVFMIDSNDDTPDGNSSTSVQAVWLADELSKSDSPWNIVVMHHPPYSNDTADGSFAGMRWDFTGADLVIAGHSLTYQRNYVGGIYYMVNGLGGSINPVNGFGADESWTQETYNSYYGAGIITATPNKLVWEFRAPISDSEGGHLTPENPSYPSFSFYDTFETYDDGAEPDSDGQGWSGDWAFLPTNDYTTVAYESFDHTDGQTIVGKTGEFGLGAWS